jgi:hypothetical protein
VNVHLLVNVHDLPLIPILAWLLHDPFTCIRVHEHVHVHPGKEVHEHFHVNVHLLVNVPDLLLTLILAWLLHDPFTFTCTSTFTCILIAFTCNRRAREGITPYTSHQNAYER